MSCDEHASAQLCRIPTAAGEWKSARTRSRMRPRVVVLTSFDVLYPLKLNHDALPFPLAPGEGTVTGDLAEGVEEKEMLVELPDVDGRRGDELPAIGSFKSVGTVCWVPEVMVS